MEGSRISWSVNVDVPAARRSWTSASPCRTAIVNDRGHDFQIQLALVPRSDLVELVAVVANPREDIETTR